YLKNGIPHERRNNFHFFSSFFFRKLADLDKNPSSVFDGKAAFQRVRRWTRKINIFEKDYIFIPVNYNLHWSLVILCHPGEVANFNEENINEALKVPCILHMDSIRGSHAGLKDRVQSYLLEEWKERQKETSEDVYSKFLNLRFLSLEVYLLQFYAVLIFICALFVDGLILVRALTPVSFLRQLPQQENCSDCGLFLLHYAELFIDEAPPNFSPFRINKFDHFLKPNWFIPAEASLKRVHIQRLIYELLKCLSHECASPPKNNFSHSPTVPVNKENDNGIEIISENGSLDKSWNGSSLYSQSVEGTEMSVLDMPIYRPSHCVNSSELGMTELLEQQSQRYDRGASLAQLGFSLSTIGEEEGDEHLTRSNLRQTGYQPTDQVGDFHINCSSSDFDQTIHWNSDSPDQVDSEDPSSSCESRSCDDSSEDTMILEFSREIQSIDPCSYENTDLSKEVMDSPEGFASASSDMMETPAEDSQELAEKFGSNDQDDPTLSIREHKVKGSQEELVTISLSSVDDKLAVDDGKIEDVEGVDTHNLAAKDSKREDDEIVAGADADNLAVKNSKSEDDEIVTGADRIVEDSPPEQLRPAKRMRVSPSPDEEERV
ncbi:hypothetical protein KSS87_012417, partial [Heliosperma pusillum]